MSNYIFKRPIKGKYVCQISPIEFIYTHRNAFLNHIDQTSDRVEDYIGKLTCSGE